ncbi:Cytochrome P450 monooxygenase sdnE [Lachnellula suecica]|uniref:Cytochrome P450 monooxygenase sdnE n=1 Tax=Lachnellula suecica TaxID=602035 RepID=A0A8T9CJ77_9HELO|nr:Cytochrome P450 monooxygenase sdnE [Lachnellula suecica]
MSFITPLNLFLTLAGAQLLHILYVLVFRSLLSPLARIPGPRLAALTGWYECYYDVFYPGQYVFKIKQLHQQFGPIVRITPREVSISDLNFLDAIYSPGVYAKRDKDFEKVKALGINTSIGGAVGHDLHRRRRESLNPFFSKKGVLALAPQLQSKIFQLNSILAVSQKTGEVVNLSDIYFAFASEQNVLANSVRAAGMRNNVATVLRGVKFNLHFSWVRSLARMLPSSLMGRWVPQGVKDMMKFRQAIRREVEQILQSKDDSKSSHSVFLELRDSPTLPASEKTAQRLEDEAALLVMAGTESPAKSITIAHYHLLSNPDLMSKLRAELSEHPSTTLSEIDQLPYVRAISLEANRLSFGLTGRNPRIAPDETLTYTDLSSKVSYSIPPGTPVSTSTLLAHTNEQVFPDPWTFNPDRWLGNGMEKKKYMLAFSKGPRQCIGMHLADAEAMIAIAEMGRWGMELFETNDGDVKFLHDYHVATPNLNSLGVRARVLGRVDL